MFASFISESSHIEERIKLILEQQKQQKKSIASLTKNLEVNAKQKKFVWSQTEFIITSIILTAVAAYTFFLHCSEIQRIVLWHKNISYMDAYGSWNIKLNAAAAISLSLNKNKSLFNDTNRKMISNKNIIYTCHHRILEISQYTHTHSIYAQLRWIERKGQKLKNNLKQMKSRMCVCIVFQK